MQTFSRRFLQVGVSIFFIAALALSAQAATFSKASLKGSYSFLINLSTANPSSNEFGMVGVLTFDGKGNVTGSFTSNTAGAVLTGTLGGTYTVSSNGTGTITFTTGSTARFAMTLNSTTAGVAAGVQLLQTNDTNNEIQSGTAVLQSTTAQTYTVASLNGTYSFLWNMWTATSSFPEFGTIGVITFDGKGNVSGTQTYMQDGALHTTSVTGTYTVNSNGTGIFSSTSAGFSAAFGLNSVVSGLAKGGQFLLTKDSTSGNYIISGIAQKQ